MCESQTYYWWNYKQLLQNGAETMPNGRWDANEKIYVPEHGFFLLQKNITKGLGAWLPAKPPKDLDDTEIIYLIDSLDKIGKQGAWAGFYGANIVEVCFNNESRLPANVKKALRKRPKQMENK